MPQEKINIAPLEQFVKTVRAAEASNQKEIRIDLATAKQIRHSLSLTMIRLAGNYEDLITKNKQEEQVIKVSMDGGAWS